VRRAILTLGMTLFGVVPAAAQESATCRILCAPAFKAEPTITFTNLFGSPRILTDDGQVTHEPRETEFEVILSLVVPARVSWLEFTVEAIVQPFERESTPELELESNFVWLPALRTRGWISSHVDIVDKFSAAGRPGDRRAYTHKLNVELDTSLRLFNRLPAERWLHGVELEGSLDYVATGLPRQDDVIDGRRYLDDASPWSFSFVLVLPVAPL
jgi:hypothetical protein